MCITCEQGANGTMNLLGEPLSSAWQERKKKKERGGGAGGGGGEKKEEGENKGTCFSVMHSGSAKKNDTRHFFTPLHPLSLVVFATATVVAFVLLRSSWFNFHCYTQREATPTQKLAWK